MARAPKPPTIPVAGRVPLAVNAALYALAEQRGVTVSMVVAGILAAAVAERTPEG